METGIAVFGPQRKMYANDTGAVIVEVNPKGEVVRTWTFPRGWAIYRIEPITSQTTSNPFNNPTTSAIIALVVAAVVITGSALFFYGRRKMKTISKASQQTQP
jgi:hypothetical protein